MRVPFNILRDQFYNILLKTGFSKQKAEFIARIFAENSRDGVYSHGLNRFPVFIEAVKKGSIALNTEPQILSKNGSIEYWDGQLGPGMYIATLAIDRAIAIAKESGIGCVSVKNSNHWMRGGIYGWQAADAGCVGICTSNTIANMPPWGGREPRLGNNPLVVAIPRPQGHLVLDMALSQFSYGKLQEYELSGRELPVAGGYDEEGRLTTNPQQVRATQRSLPIGFWKGSGLSFMLDVLVASLSAGQSVGQITAGGSEIGLSQFFLCINAPHLNQLLINEIIQYTKSSQPASSDGKIYYPGEKTLAIRIENERNGIPVNNEIWQQVLKM
ncbi:3-dehydro-L-gulonate 2-dehydrogenase [Chitinophagaceae bacterium LB-8]|uniref:3-dehydro-L-gulonate 2-dehydrogenase n=1 Tax=Paraflavisolibacter caeni TaxID=2982496 RepID=A0A9X2XWP7_9BACT|nr:3-dehydro-L-gulonate 2-dehydrogenase [Paraflavisolibacter caeni]MCU7550285.1 3-dehydro-L-gulonate 2-dehydrogenase [Paraflavisolibacter caeni]